MYLVDTASSILWLTEQIRLLRGNGRDDANAWDSALVSTTVSLGLALGLTIVKAVIAGGHAVGMIGALFASRS